MSVSPGSSTSCLDGCHCRSSFPFLEWKMFYCLTSPRCLYPLLASSPTSFPQWVGLLSLCYAHNSVLCKKKCPSLVLRAAEGGRTALIRHLVFPVWKARAHSSGVFVYWRHDESRDRPGCEAVGRAAFGRLHGRFYTKPVD